MPALPALAVAPLAALTLVGATDQVHQGVRGAVQATVAADGRSLARLVVDARLRCAGGGVDVRTFTATDVNVTPKGAFRARGTFTQPATSADGRAVTARFATRVAGRFTAPRRMAGTLTARAAFEVDGAVYAICRAKAIRFSARAPR